MIGFERGVAAEFETFFRLLQNSFPADEYRAYEGQKALLDDERYTLDLVWQEDELVAAAAVWQFDDFAFLEHLAVSPQKRCQGLGAELLQRLLNQIPTRLCLEVELPETSLAQRRIGFYQRNGLTFNDYFYIQPAFSSEKRPVPLRIMSSQGGLSQAQFQAVKMILYREVYHVKQQEST